MKIYKDVFNRIVDIEHLFDSWDRFKSDKQKKKDVLRFERDLERHIFQLHRDLVSKQYRHGAYSSFFIHDPKRRHIHKAMVRDRVLHHAIFSVFNPIFEPTFIANSFSCRVDKGTHKGVETLAKTCRQVSKNYTSPCFVLKCDIKKFFDSVNHSILLDIIKKRIKDTDAMWLIEEIVESFATNKFMIKIGVPIGNLTSQLFANIYLNEFDQFIKHDLRVGCYLRYTDDFVVVSDNLDYLNNLLPQIKSFLEQQLCLQLHPNKVIVRKLSQGIDFLGYRVLPHYQLVKTKTKRRVVQKIKQRITEYEQSQISRETLEQSFQSYLGVLSHADNYALEQELKNFFWFYVS